MWWSRRYEETSPSIEAVRKHARILVIDDQAFPAQATFERDGYHIERWPEVKNLSQLTDGHYHLILLDIQGVGLNESPDLQGFGILRHIKWANPAQPVIAYSAQPQSISRSEYANLADAILDKGMSYLQYKESVDHLLLRRATPAYFVSVANRELGDQAALVPKLVPRMLKALRNGRTESLDSYLRAKLPDREQADRIIAIVSIGVQVLRVLAA